MIVIHRPSDETPGILDRRILSEDEPIPPDALWIDLIRPTPAEDRKTEIFLGIEVPTREEQKDIEPSELLYAEHGARYLTTRLLIRADEDDPELSGITFILKGNALVTVRYAEPRAFSMFTQKAGRPYGCGRSGEEILGGLVETIMDRAADILQLAGERIDSLSRTVFRSNADPGVRNAEYQDTLRALGHWGDLISKQRESLVSIERTLLFLSASYRASKVEKGLRDQMRTTLRDLQSLEEHATFQAAKIQFLLDATLGLVNLEQNNIIKLFSVMAVVFMPPTLIASIYGMNFKNMPELEVGLGYPLALLLMVVAAIAPYFFFRLKRWL
ncbi:magnesium transporter CorA family protein [Enterovirga rhinocerotis]|uniref:Magnesium transport protein CorA n=1 Tax=Enterovirga rhinocerotis TaxID=1339210 RepID=A0A4R7C6V8_9HYPH|nr:magnesium transporter CorA family protein [Enterovirga rhinocerotis]TDR94324.1 magnesium transporter [Enterovirga rhinocerotis]